MDDWTQEEELALIDAHHVYGNKWAEIAKVLPGRNKVAACAKHFVGDGGTTKGINENDTRIEMNELLSIHMPPYVHSILKGVSTVMVSYSSFIQWIDLFSLMRSID
ncbi:hypothetical protein QQ045_011287 [Rhodiola kirilowii]